MNRWKQGIVITAKYIMDKPALKKECSNNAFIAVKERFSLDNTVTQAYNLYKIIMSNAIQPKVDLIKWNIVR